MHPINRFWIEKSGWSTSECPNIDDGLSEAQLSIASWNEAVRNCQDLIKNRYGLDFSKIANSLEELKYVQE